MRFLERERSIPTAPSQKTEFQDFMVAGDLRAASDRRNTMTWHPFQRVVSESRKEGRKPKEAPIIEEDSSKISFQSSTISIFPFQL
jgi:hypothetical protein